MGNIEFVGIIDDDFSIGKVNLPDNANVIEGVNIIFKNNNFYILKL